ncbi:MAG: HAMP domain-containing histidine kinase [Burkholderiaceae bacterium]|nr:HAMP domain-containing histidine kinase [Burkholderiaceae bacterium]
MSAAVAHEFRNPLAAISQANALLAEELAEPAQQRLTDMIRQNARRLAHIVDDVLDVARAPGLADETEGLVLNDETEAFCAEWAAQHGAGARLELHLLAPELTVRFAREHLRRLLVNLLDNAARYASVRPGAIQVTTQAIRHGPVLLSVWSDGAPLDPVVQSHLFEPFSSSESRSSGLGLFICRELCERHGAELAHERTVRVRAGQPVEGNAFSIQMRRAPGSFSSSSFGESSF